jgi:hypothetical protein
LPEGMRGVPRPDGKGGVLIVSPHGVINRLKAMRGAGESYSDVIFRVASAPVS